MNRLRFAHRSSIQTTLCLIAKALDGVPRTGHVAVLCLAMLTLGAMFPNAHAQAGEWAWLGGGGYTPTGVYGTLGVPAAGNVPGGRMGAVGWTDATGNLWLFGGHGFDSAGTKGELNDLWEFNPATREWAWMGGSPTVPLTSNYETGTSGSLTVTVGTVTLVVQ
jgi:Galactose oxidase, central domain